MRLLNTRSLFLESFDGKTVPPYAILSHTWGDEEIRYEDVGSGHSSQAMPFNKEGYSKIKYSCDQAQCDGLEYIWIDTCCINKSSSAELSEAINSMFSWYERARVCYVYLFDVNHPNYPDVTFEGSRWFRRGWTLQELIAPVHVQFYDHNWMCLGDKGTHTWERTVSDTADEFEGFEAILNLRTKQPEDYEGNLVYRIENTTRIPIEVLTLRQRPISRLLSRFPAAQRLSWAANRQTARLEDRAYSLLGLFDINMPLLYGEGKEAFIRLQQQIMNRYHDQTLLAFTRHDQVQLQLFGPLADDPNVFADSNIVRVPRSKRGPPMAPEEPASQSWRHIETRMYLCTSLGHEQRYALGILDCGYSDDPLSRPAILLRRLDGLGLLYRRIEHSTLCRIRPSHLLNSELVQVDLRHSFEEKIAEFDVKRAYLKTIKVVIGSSFTLDYGQLYAITPPTQIVLDSEYAVLFSWPRPPEPSSQSQAADEKLTLWLGATSDYDPDRVELKSVRDSFGADALVSGVIGIARFADYSVSSDDDDAEDDDSDVDRAPETYLVLWGLKQQPVPSPSYLQVSHSEAYPESAWCYVVAWENIFDPSVATIADEILQMDLAGILAKLQATLQLTSNDLKESWTVVRSRPGLASGLTARVSCLDFFGQETLRLGVENSDTDRSTEGV